MKLEVSGLNSHYGPAHILFDVGFEIGAGEVVALLGRNGAGKSTTFRSVVGLVSERSGQIRFDGADISRLPTYEIARRGRLCPGRPADFHGTDGGGEFLGGAPAPPLRRCHLDP